MTQIWKQTRRTGRKGTKVHCVHLENMQDPWVWPGSRDILQRKHRAQNLLILLANPPHNQLVITPVSEIYQPCSLIHS